MVSLNFLHNCVRFLADCLKFGINFICCKILTGSVIGGGLPLLPVHCCLSKKATEIRIRVPYCYHVARRNTYCKGIADLGGIRIAGSYFIQSTAGREVCATPLMLHSKPLPSGAGGWG